LVSLTRLESIFARLRANAGESWTLELNVTLSIHKRTGSSTVATSAERPRLSAMLISPTSSPGPSTARITSVPSVLIPCTFALPKRIT
jgi:hypothetical protein